MVSVSDNGCRAKLIDFGLALELDPESPLVTDRKTRVVGGEYKRLLFLC